MSRSGLADGEAAADAGHAVDLGKRSQDDEVLVRGDKVEHVRCVGKVDVGFVDKQDGALGFVIERPGDLCFAGEGAGGVVGIADVDNAGVRVGRDQRLHVMRIGCGERHLADLSLRDDGGAHRAPRRKDQR